MRILCVCAFLWCCINGVIAQPVQRYVLYLADKSNNDFTLSQPQQFLTTKAIERRAKQGIAIDSLDLPISATYINQLTATGVKILAKSKWLNAIVIQADSSSLVQQALNFPFVKSYRRIYSGQRKATVNNKFKNEDFIISGDVCCDDYGKGYNQAEMLSATALHKMGYKGAGVTIAVLDNGFFALSRMESFANILPRVKGTWDFINDEADVYNKGGHGTSVLSCIAANQPGSMVGTGYEADYYLFVTEDDNGETILEEYHWAEGAEMADSLGVDILSTSLGYTDFDFDSLNHNYGDMNGDSTPITKAANIAFTRGMLVVNSAGNEGARAWYYISAPADGKNVLAVGAVDKDGIKAPFSSHGPNSSGAVKPNVCALGLGAAVINTGGEFGISNGTSFSCPIISGAAACLWQAFPNKTAAQIKWAIERSADRYSNPDNQYGYGIPDFYFAYWLLTDTTTLNIPRADEAVSYPNPFGSSLWVSFYSPANEIVNISIYDIAGKKVLETTVQAFADDMNRLEICDADKLQAGEYIIKITSGVLSKTQRLLKFK